MTQESPNFVEYRPPADGVAPPYWREGMAWGRYSPAAPHSYSPEWVKGAHYQVAAEALTAPNETAGQKIIGALEEAIAMVRAMSPDELAKHGITLSEPKDWATELWADTFEVFGRRREADLIRSGQIDEPNRKAIALIRERVVLKEGV